MKGKWYLTYMHFGYTGSVAMTTSVELRATNEQDATREGIEKLEEAKRTSDFRRDICKPEIHYIISLDEK